MQTQVFFKESKRFLKENKKRILLFTILGAVLFAILTTVDLIKNNKDSSVKDATIKEVKNMAEFSIYIEKKDEIPFNNNALLEKILFSENAVKQAELETRVEISDLLETQEETEFIPTGEDRGVIGVIRDVTNEAMVFQFKVGAKKDNMKVATYYFEKIKNNEVDILKDKKIFILSVPETKELVKENTSFIEEQNTKVSPLLLMVELLVSLFAGFVLGVLITILYHVFNKKINYAFNYDIDEKDIFLMERESQDKFVYDVTNPKDEKKIIVSEQMLPTELLNKLAKKSDKVMTTSDLIEISPKTEIPEIVFVIVENSTTKYWYNLQREYLKKFDSTIKVIQVPASIVKTH